MIVTKELALHAVYGGLLYGGGGGGTLAGGLKVLDIVFGIGAPELIEIGALDADATVATASLVGSPASEKCYVGLEHYKRVHELMKTYGVRLDGIITNEMGAESSTNGFILSALTGIPLVDAPCNGRAHPTGTMGSMGLHRQPGYESVQAAAGGRGALNTELIVKANVESSSLMIRNASIAAGGYVTVLRNPVRARFVGENAAVGAFSASLAPGRVIYENTGKPQLVLAGLMAFGLEVVGSGAVTAKSLEIKGGFDLGTIIVGAEGFEVVFWNEYMTLEHGGERLATFPDLIALIDAESGLPQTSAEIKTGQSVHIVKIPRGRLRLSPTMHDAELLAAASGVISKAL